MGFVTYNLIEYSQRNGHLTEQSGGRWFTVIYFRLGYFTSIRELSSPKGFISVRSL